jgi:MSHA biogenesis protein MshK
MVETVMRNLALGMLCVCAVTAHAQTVQDPTRPPVQLLRPSAAEPAVHAPQVQSILIGRAAGGRRVAVIDGDTVRVGDMVGGARVVGMTPSTVILARAGRRETLPLQAADAAVTVPVTAPPPLPAAKPE